jgi:hypothetical protein
MTDGGIGRILVASLHQSIGDSLPTRLEYYEHWLTPMGLRDGRIGRAPLGAVLSFLRQEGPLVYDRVMTGAGHCSAEWYHARGGVMSWLVRMLPVRLRARLALRQTRRLLRSAFTPAHVRVSTGRGVGAVTVTSGILCDVRERWAWPTCRYYAAAIERSLALQGVPAAVAIESCQATADGPCRVAVTFYRFGLAPAAEPAAEAAP